MAKSEAKESIGMCVCGWRDVMNLSEPFQALLLYFISLRTCGKIMKVDVREDHA
jgi:hypothetical protein